MKPKQWKLKIGDKENTPCNDRVASFSHIPEYNRSDGTRHFFNKEVDSIEIDGREFPIHDTEFTYFRRWHGVLHNDSGPSEFFTYHLNDKEVARGNS